MTICTRTECAELKPCLAASESVLLLSAVGGSAVLGCGAFSLKL